MRYKIGGSLQFSLLEWQSENLVKFWGWIFMWKLNFWVPIQEPKWHTPSVHRFTNHHQPTHPAPPPPHSCTHSIFLTNLTSKSERLSDTAVLIYCSTFEYLHSHNWVNAISSWITYFQCKASSAIPNVRLFLVSGRHRISGERYLTLIKLCYFQVTMSFNKYHRMDFLPKYVHCC